MPINYELGKIYKINDNTNEKIYIGSTCDTTLSRRLAGHKCNYNTYLKGKCNYITSVEILQNNNYDIILIENFPCNNKDELTARERYHIQNNHCVNKMIPGRSQNEYKQDNRETILKQNKEYYINNKEKISEMCKTHYIDNKEKYLQYNKEYYQTNKDKINEQSSTKYHCECGSNICKSTKYKHIKSLKHQKYLALLSNSI